MTKHTQGEWGVAKIDNGQADDEIVSTVNGCMVNIASVFGAGEYSEYRPAGEVEPSYEVSKEEAAANALLLAAAPALLEAVKSMLVCIGDDPRFYAEEKAATEALVKAGVTKFGKWIKQ